MTNGLSTVAAGLLLSHISHLLSVIQLWALVKTSVGDQKQQDHRLAFNAAVLHIISPAGVFLSAPYAESPFAFLSMSGFLAFAYALQHFDKHHTFAGSANMVLAGVIFFAATMMRSNGILAGLPMLIEAITKTLSILTRRLSKMRIAQLMSIVVGGLLVGMGLVVPQLLAHQEYCTSQTADERRPWCNQSLPSIFTWVQSHYW